MFGNCATAFCTGQDSAARLLSHHGRCPLCRGIFGRSNNRQSCRQLTYRGLDTSGVRRWLVDRPGTGLPLGVVCSHGGKPAPVKDFVQACRRPTGVSSKIENLLARCQIVLPRRSSPEVQRRDATSRLGDGASANRRCPRGARGDAVLQQFGSAPREKNFLRSGHSSVGVSNRSRPRGTLVRVRHPFNWTFKRSYVMNASIRAGLVLGWLAMLPTASAWATMPKAGSLPAGSGILVQPGNEEPGPTYYFKVPPRFPGQLPPTVPPWMLQKRGEPRPRPLPRPLVHPPLRFQRHGPTPLRILPIRPRPFTPVIPPPPRGPMRQLKPWPVLRPLVHSTLQPVPRPMNLHARR